MTLKGKFIREDMLSGRKRLGPLGWVGVFIVAVFAFASVLGAYRLLTHNVTSLADSRAVGATTTIDSSKLSDASPSTDGSTSKDASKDAQEPALAATRPITWTVWAAQDPLGQPIYEGAPETKAWVLRDYRNAQEWLNAHLLEKDYLLQHMNEYFSSKALADGRRNIDRAFSETFVIMAPSLAQPRQRPPMDRPRFVTFSPDGRQARVNDYTGPGAAKQYNTRTRKPMTVSLKNGFVWQYLLEYDPDSNRWKIARNTQVINIETNELVFSDEP